MYRTDDDRIVSTMSLRAMVVVEATDGRSDRPPPQARRLNVPSDPHSKLEFVTRQVAVAPDYLRIL